MKFFYIPITNKNSLKNYKNTVINRINFKNESIVEVTDNCGVWGIKNGKSNTRTYEAIDNGDIIFFRITDDNNYQAFDGFGRVKDKVSNSKLANYFWNDNSYENIIYFDELILFKEPFKISKNGKKLSTLNFGNIWHDAYNMFREWKIKEESNIKNFDELINYFLTFEHEIKYTPQTTDISFKKKEEKEEIEEDILDSFDREAITKIRIGHSKLKDELLLERKKCQLCGINKKELLRASHIKPWSCSNGTEKLDLNNVLLLCSMHDILFDRGFISFDNFGNIIISGELDEVNRVYSNVNTNMRIKINSSMKKYLMYHRDNILKK